MSIISCILIRCAVCMNVINVVMVTSMNAINAVINVIFGDEHTAALRNAAKSSIV